MYPALRELPGGVRDAAGYLRSKGVPDWNITFAPRIDGQVTFGSIGGALQDTLERVQLDRIATGKGANSTLETKLPTGVGGTGANYDKVAGQGIYVLRDEIGNVKYVGRGDAPDRLATHADSIDKGDFIGEILWPNNLLKAQAKGLEQKLTDHYGGAARQNPNTPLLNQYRSFAPENPNATLYRDSVTKELWGATLKRVGK